MTTPLPHAAARSEPMDLVAASAGRLEAAQDAGDIERLRVLDELYADLEAALDKEMAFPPSTEAQDFEQTGSAGR